MHGVLLAFDLVISESKGDRSPDCKSLGNKSLQGCIDNERDYNMWLEFSFIGLVFPEIELD